MKITDYNSWILNINNITKGAIYLIMQHLQKLTAPQPEGFCTEIREPKL